MSDSVKSESVMLRRAYEDLDFELVTVHDNLQVPSATPARFEYSVSPFSTDADEILDRLEDSTLTLIDVLAQNGSTWYEFNVSAKAFTQTDEFSRISISTAGVTIFKKSEELSFEGFKEIVDAVEWAIGTDLEYVEGDDDE